MTSDGRDRLAVNEGREIEATRDGGAIDQHGAAAAQPLRAAFARAEEIKAIAQNLDDGLMGRDLGRDLLAVEGEVDGAAHIGLTVVASAAASPAHIIVPSPLAGEGKTNVQQ